MVEHNLEKIWHAFAEKFQLTDQQLTQFQRYAALIQASLHNVTALSSIEDIITYHFADSLELGNCIDMNSVRGCVDVGTGGGFPGLALKIAYPQCSMILIEVVGKKREFLAQVVQELGLEQVIIEGCDWRTFLRKTSYAVDLVCSRAALAPNELIRMFQESSPYRSATLVYWAAKSWEPSAHEASYIRTYHSYQNGSKERALVVMSAVPKS